MIILNEIVRHNRINVSGVLPGQSSMTEPPFSYFRAVPYRFSGMLRLNCSNTSTMLTPSRICPMPATPEIAALAPLESSVPSTCATPRTTIITAVDVQTDLIGQERFAGLGSGKGKALFQQEQQPPPY